MSMLLLIRSADDVRSAVETASEFLVYPRQRFAEAREADEVFGIWLRRELDADSPAWLWLDRDRGAGMSTDVPGDTSKVIPGESGVGIRESFSRSGMTKLEMQDAPRVSFIMGSKSDWMGHVLILDEDGQDGAEVAEAIAADLERAVAAGPGERAWT